MSLRKIHTPHELRTKEFLNFAISYANEYQQMPSYETIGKFLNLKSKSSVHFFMRRLADEGIISMPGNRAEGRFKIKGYHFQLVPEEKEE